MNQGKFGKVNPQLTFQVPVKLPKIKNEQVGMIQFNLNSIPDTSDYQMAGMNQFVMP